MIKGDRCCMLTSLLTVAFLIFGGTSHTLVHKSPAMSACPKPEPGSGGEKKHCIPCEGGIPAVTPERLQEGLAKLPLWSLEEKHLSRKFTAKKFVEAMAFLNAVADIAEKEGHHPDLHLTSYRNIEVVLYTHAVSGITENDLIMASLIDDVEVIYSPKWLEEHPEAEGTAKK